MLNKPTITWRNGQPYAMAFDDVYFSTDDGWAETEYVFLHGNDLAHRWQRLSTRDFVIYETGFGTGLNFLCAVQLWLKNKPSKAILHYYSVEMHPLNIDEICQALQLWPQLKKISTPFLAQYPQTLQNPKPITLFDDRVKLTLRIGDATAMLSELHHQADAWFLDGFAPSKNPEMWQAALFAQMARLSHQATTFATFTSAGAVRRGLIEAGFAVNKREGFGKKREMLHGHFSG